MLGRLLKWVGAALFAGAAVGMGFYFARVGLEKADQMASVVGAFIALAGLGLGVYGTLTERQAHLASAPVSDSATAPNSEKSATRGSGGVQNEISGGVFYAPVMQGRDFEQITFESPVPPAWPQPAGPSEDTDGTAVG